MVEQSSAEPREAGHLLDGHCRIELGEMPVVEPGFRPKGAERPSAARAKRGGKPGSTRLHGERSESEEVVEPGFEPGSEE